MTTRYSPEEFARGVWQELVERAHRFSGRFADRPAEIPADLAREDLRTMQSQVEDARSRLMLDVLTTAGARWVASLIGAVADAPERPDVDGRSAVIAAAQMHGMQQSGRRAARRRVQAIAKVGP